MKKFKSLFLFACCIFVIPIIGIIVSELVSHTYENTYQNTLLSVIKEKRGVDLSQNTKFLNEISLDNVCKKQDLDPTFSKICTDYSQINYLGYGSTLTIIFILLLLIITPLLGFFSRKNRMLLFCIFKPGLIASKFSTIVLIISCSAIAIFSLYLAESYYLGSIHIGWIIILSLAALTATYRMCVIAFKPLPEPKLHIFGRLINKDNHSLIWSFVEEIAKKLNTIPPQNIIAGMDATFFVTETNTVCLDGEVKGKTLFLSLPFCNVLSREELSAIIGHELGHFIGEDTKWSKKFYPIYRKSLETVATLQNGINKNGLALLPALFFMNYFVTAFANTENAISRDREITADKVGIAASSKENMATSLLKAHLYQHIWLFTQNKMKEALAEGNQILNLSLFFRYTCESLPKNFMEENIGKTHTPHPTDSHPPLTIRLNAIGISLKELYSAGLTLPDDKAINLFENISPLEEELSAIEHHKLVEQRVVQVNSNTSSAPNNPENVPAS